MKVYLLKKEANYKNKEKNLYQDVKKRQPKYLQKKKELLNW